jgi:hypothetical protein
MLEMVKGELCSKGVKDICHLGVLIGQQCLTSNHLLDLGFLTISCAENNFNVLYHHSSSGRAFIQ